MKQPTARQLRDADLRQKADAVRDAAHGADWMAAVFTSASGPFAVGDTTVVRHRSPADLDGSYLAFDTRRRGPRQRLLPAMNAPTTAVTRSAASVTPRRGSHPDWADRVRWVKD